MSFDTGYKGRYPLFDTRGISHYPLSERASKVEVGDFVDPQIVVDSDVSTHGLPWYKNGTAGGGADQVAGLDEIAEAVTLAARQGKPVIAVCGAHFIKGGLSPLIVDLLRRGLISLFSGNMASAIHSFEFALTGASSESVAAGLPTGSFGMAAETNAYLNAAIRAGASDGYSAGESFGMLFCDKDFRKKVIDSALALHDETGHWLTPYDGFPYAGSCVYAAAYDQQVPACVHPSIGTDIINQYQYFDASCLGRAAGYDFLILTEEVRRLVNGGVILNIGSAVTGPEVILKACSMAANVGSAPGKPVTADFDLRPFGFDAREDESATAYYYRDQKSIVTRIPAAYGGVGYYFQGPHSSTLPALYKRIINRWSTYG